MRLQRIGWLVALVLAWAGREAGATTYGWRAGPTVPGVDGTVYATTTWDPDGPGPQPELLIVAGDFHVAGDVVANNIAAWDGHAWHALGDGFDQTVWSVTVYNGQLIAGGAFCSSGGVDCQHVVRFNGTTWEPLGDGLDYLDNIVYDLTVYNGQLVAAGMFSGIEDDSYFQFHYTPCHGVAIWDGQAWQPLADGLPSDFQPHVNCLVVYDGQLIIAGSVSGTSGSTFHVARWDGQQWQSLGDDLREDISNGLQQVTAMAVYEGKLVVTSYVEDWSSGDPQIRGSTASWDGNTWQVFGQEDGSSPMALAVWNGQLMRCSWSAPAGTAAVAYWQGNQWQYLPGNIFGDTLCTYNGDLIVGGGGSCGEVYCSGIARWDGQEWHALGEGTSCYLSTLGIFHGDLLAAGGFHFGETTYYGPAFWEGDSWRPLGPGLSDDSSPGPTVNAMAEYNGDLVIGGTFLRAGDEVCSGIARWDGQQWHALGAGMTYERVGSGWRVVYNGTVSALAACDGKLVAGGAFQTVDGMACQSVACWDGTCWQPMDAGLTGTYYTLPDSTVQYNLPSIGALAVYHSELYAGGTFGFADNPGCRNLARWDGQRWQPVGGGVAAEDFCAVECLAVYGDQLVVGGCFSQAGDVGCTGLAAWDGQQWHALSAVPQVTWGRPGNVNALAVYNGQLIAAGVFDPLDPACILANINAWDGQTWHPLGRGTDGGPYALVACNGDLVVAGGFTSVDGGKVSNQIVFWGPVLSGDINNDGYVNVADLLMLVGAWGSSNRTIPFSGNWNLSADCNADGYVNIGDLQILIANWGGRRPVDVGSIPAVAFGTWP